LQLYAEKDRNGVPVIKKKEQERRSGAFRLETNPATTILYDTRCCLNMRSEANTSQLNLPHGTNN